MIIPLVDLKAQFQSIRHEVDNALREVLEEANFILGPQVKDFEDSFAAFCGVNHCVGVANGTDALHLILRASGIGPGDEVIIPAFTFVATALGVLLSGALPVFVDVNSEDGRIDPEKIRKAITKNTRAIIPVHLYGRCVDMDSVNSIAKNFGLKIFEDAAQAHGATFNGKYAGSLGDAAGFSFYPGKNLGAYGDGGAITTNSIDLYERLILLRNWGSRKKYHHEEMGLNSRLDTLQAAVLKIKLAKLQQWNQSRRDHAFFYDSELEKIGNFRRPKNNINRVPVYHLYALRIHNRDGLLSHLNQSGIGAGIHYPFPIHKLGLFKGKIDPYLSFPEAEKWASECLSLPLYPELTDLHKGMVVQEIADWFSISKGK